jgi:hypothetical protein
MEGRDSELEDFEYEHLDLPNHWVCLGTKLIVKIIFSEADDWNKICTSSKGHLDKPLSPFQDEAKTSWLRFK